MSLEASERAHGRRRSRAFALPLLLALGCGHSDGAGGEPARARSSGPRPNVVLIVIDTARADHFSCYGYGAGTTPSVDALAARGILFRNARSVAPWTLPSHMSMFTGLAPRDHGATWAAFSEPGLTSRKLVELGFTPAEPERMLAARLRAAGYRTYGFSPNPWVSRNHGFAEGFDEFTELWRKEELASKATSGRKPDARPGARAVKRLQNPRKVAQETLANAFAASKSGAAVAGVERMLAEHPRGEPFFLFVNFLDPHFPYDPPEPLRERFAGSTAAANAVKLRNASELGMIAGLSLFTPEDLRPLYDADLAAADHAVGELVAALESAGVFEDALVLLTSDHGELLGEKGRFSHQLYVDEPLMRVPLIVKLPGGARAGTVVDDELVSNLDVYATVLAAAGVEPASAGGLSRDLLGGARGTRELLIGEYQPSHPYLEHLQGLNEAFDLEAHLRDRYVVYTREFRTEILGQEVVETTPLAGGAGGRALESRLAEAAREAERALATYLAAKDLTRSGRSGAGGDAETSAELEALGYAGSEDTEEPAPARGEDEDRR
jgi:arylsulfatase A-like enzyme